MLTAQRLLAIVGRDRRDRKSFEALKAPAGPPSAQDLALLQEMGPLPDVADMRRGACERDRSDLLDLLRRIVETSPIVNVIQCGVCEMCGRIIVPDSDRPPEGHGPDCPVPVLDALRIWDEDGYCLTCGGGPDETGAAMPGKHAPTCAEAAPA